MNIWQVKPTICYHPFVLSALGIYLHEAKPLLQGLTCKEGGEIGARLQSRGCLIAPPIFCVVCVETTALLLRKVWQSRLADYSCIA